MNDGPDPAPPRAPRHASARLGTLAPAGRPPAATTDAESAASRRNRPTFATAVDSNHRRHQAKPAPAGRNAGAVRVRVDAPHCTTPTPST